MQKLILFFLFVFIMVSMNSQELNCKATVISNQLSGSNKQLFKTLEKSINEYMNNTKWTDKQYKAQEKVQCVITLSITEQTGNDQFKGNLQVQVVRPVYNSTYLTPILNYNDNDITFTYEEFQPLLFNETSFESNLVSLLSFYAYIVLGVDADSFSKNGGSIYLRKAEKVMLMAQQGGSRGWSSIDGNFTRFKLVDNMLDATFREYRSTMYAYHLKGLDVMVKDKAKAKQNIANAIIELKKIYQKRPSAYLLRVFLDTKADEITSIFTDGPKINKTNLVEMLMRVYPARNNSWSKIN